MRPQGLVGATHGRLILCDSVRIAAFEQRVTVVTILDLDSLRTLGMVSNYEPSRHEDHALGYVVVLDEQRPFVPCRVEDLFKD